MRVSTVVEGIFYNGVVLGGIRHNLNMQIIYPMKYFVLVNRFF